MATIREISEKLFNGDIPIQEYNPVAFRLTGDSEEVADGVMFFRWLANVTAIKTSEGLVLIDTGYPGPETLAMIRRYSNDRVNTAIYTHGHLDHVSGMSSIAAEAQSNHVARPRVVGHRGIAERFDRYKRTTGYNGIVNQRQFQRPAPPPAEFVYPDTYFDHQLTVVAGDCKIECHHARGETDDHCWCYLPQQKILFTGDFIIWAAPNAGNPQKVQRYAREWAQALRAMAKLGATVLIPGHGFPVFGALEVRQMLNDAAEYLESLYDQTLKLMNEGATLDDVIHCVRPPEKLARRPYLQPIYDEPEFIVRNIWRLEGGWYDGAPSHLKPASESAQAREIASLAGGLDKVVARALGKLEAGELALACHLIDWAVAAAPDDQSAHVARTQIYQARADDSLSTMSHGIFRSAAIESAHKAGIAIPDDDRNQ